ncbi:MAG: methyltransferase domain-containing protein [Rhodospirillaceae bacterium]|nr:methyltransferase domain-containing protein [Rhodospirillaceae bacterium]
MSGTLTVFDRALVRRRRDRAAAGLAAHDFLLREVGERLADRLSDLRRRFPAALDLGCHDGTLATLLAGRGGIETLVQCDLSAAMAARAAARGIALAADEEALPFAPGAFDLVLSNLSLHWVNDLPGTLLQIRHVLRPDGLFLAALLGGETLRELRAALVEAETAERGGAAPRVSPFAELRDAAGLLQRAGFALPVADLDTVTVTYPDALALMRDLKGMGEANAVLARDRRPATRRLMARAAAIYHEHHGDAGGRVPATFQVLFLTAWAPHPAQQRPLRPGSARTRLADALGATEGRLPPGGGAGGRG